MINPKSCRYCGKRFSSYLIASHEKNCDDNPKNKEKEAYELGKKAYHAGNKRIPALDKNLLFILGGIGSNEKLYKQWLKGWDEENLNKKEVIQMKKSELKQLVREELLKESHMFKTKMIKDAKTPKGLELHTGDDVELEFPKDKVWFTHIYKSLPTPYAGSNTMKMIVQTKNLYLYVKGVTKPPSFSSLERMVEDGVAKSVLGKRVEPDGEDEYGSPSWLMVLGYM